MEVTIEAASGQYRITVDAGDGGGAATLTAESELDAVSAAWQ